jgi:hypothetical protein
MFQGAFGADGFSGEMLIGVRTIGVWIWRVKGLVFVERA